MGKSAVLKDLSNRPAGYVLLSGGSAVCRTHLDRPAQLVLVLADGSQITHTLDGGADEQRFPCEGSAMLGCYVFRMEELLLISDEAMRCAFERQALALRNSAQTQREGARETVRTVLQAQPPEREEGREKKHAFAQRRWPPPPCWEAARYLDGRWQEEQTAPLV